MRKVLVTGASGFLGSALVEKLLSRGNLVYGLSRHPPESKEHLIPVFGDICEPNLGIERDLLVPDALYHLAALHRLGQDKAQETWQTNAGGTANVINYCERRGIPHLLFVSSAYTQGRNPYERSKAYCEHIVQTSRVQWVTVFKPSIVMGTPQHFYPGHFSQFVKLLVKVLQREEPLRRALEGTLRLPPLELDFRLSGNPGGKLNIIQIDSVVDAMASITNTGVFWLTHPCPPTLGEIVGWVSECIKVNLEIQPYFSPNAVETVFQKLGAAFEPYMWGDDFPSDINPPPITRDFIHDTVVRTFLS